MVGFCTDEGLGNLSNFRHAKSAYYNCWGSFWEGGNRSDLQTSDVGDVICCEPDLFWGVLRWLKNGTMIKEYKLPPSMKDEKLHLSIIMADVGDEVEISS